MFCHSGLGFYPHPLEAVHATGINVQLAVMRCILHSSAIFLGKSKKRKIFGRIISMQLPCKRAWRDKRN